MILGGKRTAATTNEESNAGQDTGNGDSVGDKLRLCHVDTCDQQGRGEEDQARVGTTVTEEVSNWKTIG